MEATIEHFDDNEPTVDETVDERAEAAEGDAGTMSERPRGRGRGWRRGRPFGPNRPYRFALFVEDDGTLVLRSPDLAERSATIASLDELGAAMQTAIDERAAEDAAAAAEAAKDADYSGKFVLRLPRSMHRQLSELAEAEGVSLNQLALGFLAEGMGRAEMTQEQGERRGPRGGHRGPGGRGARHGRGRHGNRGPEDFGPEEHRFGDRDPEGRGSGRRPWKRDQFEQRFGGHGPGFGRGHRQLDFISTGGEERQFV